MRQRNGPDTRGTTSESRRVKTQLPKVRTVEGNRVRDLGRKSTATDCLKESSVTVQLAEAICINGIVMAYVPTTSYGFSRL